jgi:hypothetical protein
MMCETFAHLETFWPDSGLVPFKWRLKKLRVGEYSDWENHGVPIQFEKHPNFVERPHSIFQARAKFDPSRIESR